MNPLTDFFARVIAAPTLGTVPTAIARLPHHCPACLVSWDANTDPWGKHCWICHHPGIEGVIPTIGVVATPRPHDWRTPT